MHYIVDADGEKIAGLTESFPNAKSNADFIVKAVGNFKEAAATAKELREFRELLIEARPFFEAFSACVNRQNEETK